MPSESDPHPVDGWRNAADGIWDEFKGSVGLAVPRTTDRRRFFYAFGNGSPRAWWLVRDARIEGWFGLLVTAMKDNPYSAICATLTDCIGTPDALRRRCADEEVRSRRPPAGGGAVLP